MASYKLQVSGVTTGSTANTFSTLLALKIPNTAVCRGRLRRLIVGGAGGASQDAQLSLRLRRTDNTTDGTSTAVNVNTIGKANQLQRTSAVSAVGKNFSAEPTAFDTQTLAGGAIAARNTLTIDWDREEAPEWGITQTLCLEGAPGVASAITLDVVLEWDED